VTDYDLHPKTRPVAVATLRVGDIVLESPEHPARVTRLKGETRINVWCRYVWTPPTDPDWRLGTFALRDRIEKVVKR
jgi:hypothetical protein